MGVLQVEQLNRDTPNISRAKFHVYVLDPNYIFVDIIFSKWSEYDPVTHSESYFIGLTSTIRNR